MQKKIQDFWVRFQNDITLRQWFQTISGEKEQKKKKLPWWKKIESFKMNLNCDRLTVIDEIRQIS